MALVKYNNNSLSSVTSAASFSSGAMTHIKTLTASSSATLSFVDGSSDVVLDDTYPVYIFKFISIHQETNNQDFSFQASTNTGSSYGVTCTSTIFKAYHDEGDSYTSLGYDTGSDIAQGTGFKRLMKLSNGNDESGSGTLYLFNPSSTTFVKHFMGECLCINSNTYTQSEYTAGYFNTTSAIDAIQFKFSSGDIDSGTIKLYGLKDS